MQVTEDAARTKLLMLSCSFKLRSTRTHFPFVASSSFVEEGKQKSAATDGTNHGSIMHSVIWSSDTSNTTQTWPRVLKDTSHLQPVSCCIRGSHTSNGRLAVSTVSVVVTFHQSTPSGTLPTWLPLLPISTDPADPLDASDEPSETTSHDCHPSFCMLPGPGVGW